MACLKFENRQQGLSHDLLAGWWAGIVVTMGLPALIYRWYFQGH